MSFMNMAYSRISSLDMLVKPQSCVFV